MSKLSAFKVSAPGSTMLMGEHAVLLGHTALVCALDVRIYITVQPREDRLVCIESALGHYQSNLDALEENTALSFVLAAIVAYQDRLHTGFELHIHSDFSSTIGLGSSAAITAAMVTALNHLIGLKADLMTDFRQGLAIIHAVQKGRGSGADLAASILGGLVCFNNEPLQMHSLPCPNSMVLALYYSGYKMKTPDVLAKVEQQWHLHASLLQSLYALMGDTSRVSINALKKGDLIELGQLMNVYQGLMDALGVCDSTLSQMIYTLRQDSRVLGAKISGSGLGDCVLTLGSEVPSTLSEHACLAIRPAPTGVWLEERVD